MILSNLLAMIREMLVAAAPALAVAVVALLVLWWAPALFVGWRLGRRLKPLEATVASLLGAGDRPSAGADFEFRLRRLERLSDDWVSDQKDRHDEDAAALLGSLLEISETIRHPGSQTDRRNGMRKSEA